MTYRAPAANVVPVFADNTGGAVRGSPISVDQDGNLTGAKLGGTDIATLIGFRLGNSAAYLKTAAGVTTLLAAAAVDRAVQIVVHVDETFADGDTSQTTFSIGQTGAATKFAATSAFTGKAAGTALVFAGILSANAALIVTAVAAVGTGTGGLTATAIAAPTA